MAKTRLRNDDRDAIKQAIIEHKFAPIDAALLAEEIALAVQVRAKAHGAHLAMVDGAPEGAFPTDTDMQVNVGGRRLRFRFGADWNARARIFAKFERDYALTLTDADKFGAKLLDHASRVEANKQERASLRAKVGATLSSFNSFDDLLAGWPEADRFITERWRQRGDYVSNVPAVQLAELTAALDLPPDAQAEAA